MLSHFITNHVPCCSHGLKITYLELILHKASQPLISLIVLDEYARIRLTTLATGKALYDSYTHTFI